MTGEFKDSGKTGRATADRPVQVGPCTSGLGPEGEWTLISQGECALLSRQNALARSSICKEDEASLLTCTKASGWP